MITQKNLQTQFQENSKPYMKEEPELNDNSDLDTLKRHLEDSLERIREFQKCRSTKPFFSRVRFQGSIFSSSFSDRESLRGIHISPANSYINNRCVRSLSSYSRTPLMILYHSLLDCLSIPAAMLTRFVCKCQEVVSYFENKVN